jgi:hypothetical protein
MSPPSTSRRFEREVAAAGLLTEPGLGAPVTAAELEDLPEPARRYFGFMGTVGARRQRSFRARFDGRFNMKGRWLAARAWQQNTVDPIARVFVMRLRLAAMVPMTGVDSYVDGHGEMLGKLAGVLPVAHGEGPEFDQGELVTWLNDAVLLAPSLLLDRSVSFGSVDERTFELTVHDAGTTVRARVFVDDRGAPYDFSTTDRFADLPEGLVRAEWTTPIDGWTDDPGQPLPTMARAVWHLPEGPMTYIEGRFSTAP